MLSPALSEHLAELIPRLAGQLNRSYPRMDKEDLAQEMWLGAVKQADNLARLLEDGNLGALTNTVRGAGWRACKRDDRTRRAERAYARGYKVDDEQFYPVSMLRVLLPAYLDQGVAAEPPQGRSRNPTALNSESGDYLAMMLDIGTAMAKLKPYQAKLLRDWFSVPDNDASPEQRAAASHARTQLAHSMGLTLDTLSKRVYRALRALQGHLGGPSPWRRRPIDYEPERKAGQTSTGWVDPDSDVSGLPSRSRQAALRGYAE